MPTLKIRLIAAKALLAADATGTRAIAATSLLKRTNLVLVVYVWCVFDAPIRLERSLRDAHRGTVASFESRHPCESQSCVERELHGHGQRSQECTLLARSLGHNLPVARTVG